MVERRRSPAERRRARRTEFVAAVRVGAPGLLIRGRPDVQLALARDLGEEGIGLRCAGRRYLPCTPMTQSFELPDGGELVEVRGSVVFGRDENGYEETGVRFCDLS